MKRSTQKRFEALAASLLERVAPGAGDVFVEVLEAIDGRPPLPQVAKVAPVEVLDEPVIDAAPVAGDTIAVEITDERGRVVGWTTAKIGAARR